MSESDEEETLKFDVNFNDNSTTFKEKDSSVKSIETVLSTDNKLELPYNSINYNILPDRIPRTEHLATIVFTVKKQYEPNTPRVPHLVCGPGDSLLLSSGKSKVLKKVKCDGIYLQEEWRWKIRVHGLAVTTLNNVLIVTKDSRLMQINGTTGKLEFSKYNVAPFVPIAVHVTQSGHILVGANATNPKSPLTGRHTCILLELNQEGDIETIYSKNLFTFPCRITSTRHTIGVIDRLTDDKQGQVTVLEKDGSVVRKYTGQTSRLRKPFKPVDIVTTPMDNILVADRKNHFVHILDSVGNLKGCLDLQNHGITYPISLAYNTEGQLYMGARSSTPLPKSSQLYQVTLSGC